MERSNKYKNRNKNQAIPNNQDLDICYDKLLKNSGFFGKEIISTISSDIFQTLDKKTLIKTLEQHSVYFDIFLENGKINLKITKWLALWLEIKNRYMLLEFCKIHGFIPIIKDIYIDGENISQIKKFQFMCNFFQNYIKMNGKIPFVIYGEISKIIDKFQEIWIEEYNIDVLFNLMNIVEEVKKIAFQDIVDNFWNRLQKRNNGISYENVILEIAFRIENNLRKILNYQSTYMYWATMEEDAKDKTDIKWTFLQDNGNNKYQNIPIQLTISSDKEKYSQKVENIEVYLWEKLDEWTETFPFVIMRINGKFAKAVKGWIINKKYNQWLNDNIREQQTPLDNFPFFIDNLTERQLEWPIGTIWATHLIQELHSFDSKKQINTYLKNRVLSLQGMDFYGLDISQLRIYCDDIRVIESQNNEFVNLIFSVYYKGNFISEIGYYEDIENED